MANPAPASGPQKPASPEELQKFQERQQKAAQINDISKKLAASSEAMQRLLPKGLYAEKLIQVSLLSIAKNPKLLLCNRNTILAAVYQCAQYGLMPDGVTGEAFFIPFKETCQFLIGYKGLIKLAMRSGQVKKFIGRAVYEGDVFEYEFGTSEYIKHKPAGKTEKVTHVYYVLEYLNGGVVFDVMTAEQVDKIKLRSSNYKNAKDKSTTIWTTDYAAMAIKTIIRNAAKYAPVSTEFQLAAALDEQFERTGETIEIDKFEKFQDMSAEDQLALMQQLEAKPIDEEDPPQITADNGNSAKEKAAAAVRKTVGMLKGTNDQSDGQQQ